MAKSESELAICQYPKRHIHPKNPSNIKYSCPILGSDAVTNRSKLPCVGRRDLFGKCSEIDGERLINKPLGGHSFPEDDSANADTGSNPAKTFEDSR